MFSGSPAYAGNPLLHHTLHKAYGRLHQPTSLWPPRLRRHTGPQTWVFYFHSTKQPHPGRNQSGGRSSAHHSQTLVFAIIELRLVSSFSFQIGKRYESQNPQKSCPDPLLAQLPEWGGLHVPSANRGSWAWTACPLLTLGVFPFLGWGSLWGCGHLSGLGEILPSHRPLGFHNHPSHLSRGGSLPQG